MERNSSIMTGAENRRRTTGNSRKNMAEKHFYNENGSERRGVHRHKAEGWSRQRSDPEHRDRPGQLNRKIQPKGKRRRSRRRNRARHIIPIVLAGLIAVYLLISMKYRNVFLPNTMIGGIAVSGMNVEEVKSEIAAGISRYELVLEERDGREERIAGRAIGLVPVYDGSLEAILKQQNPLFWGIRCIRGEEYQRDYMVSFDREKAREVVHALECLKPEQITEPEDAHLAYVKGEGLQIIPEVYGNSPDAGRLNEEIEHAVFSLQERISLEQSGIYRNPVILEHDPELLARLETCKPFTDVEVTYRFGSQTEILDGGTIYQWLSDDGSGHVSPDPSMVEAYVKELAGKYNTAYHTKELKTSYGPTVTIIKGHYGWMIDQQKETAALISIILSGESQEREPVYLQRAASHENPDYGDTCVEINLTAQHLYYYKNGKLLIESDFVSGNEAKGWSTPAGAYELTYKQKNAVLRGKTYKTPVTYWMPFNGNIGMHDGYWRSSFGGTIYKKNGSHGCINLPPDVAKTIFANIEAGIPVLCYHLEGTETKKTTAVSSGKVGVTKEGAAGAGATGTDADSISGKTSENAHTETVQPGNVQLGNVQTENSQTGLSQPQTIPSGTAPPESAPPLIIEPIGAGPAAGPGL